MSSYTKLTWSRAIWWNYFPEVILRSWNTIYPKDVEYSFYFFKYVYHTFIFVIWLVKNSVRLLENQTICIGISFNTGINQCTCHCKIFFKYGVTNCMLLCVVAVCISQKCMQTTSWKWVFQRCQLEWAMIVVLAIDWFNWLINSVRDYRYAFLRFTLRTPRKKYFSLIFCQ